MTDEKLVQIFLFYLNELRTMGVEPRKLPDYDLPGSRNDPKDVLGHASWMCEKGLILVSEGKTEEAFRWLGFIRCILWMNGLYSLHEIMKHSLTEYKPI